MENESRIISMNTYDIDSTGTRIAWARKQRKWTGHDLARAVGVRNVYISQIENNHREPSRHVLMAIAAALNVTVGFLLMETDDPTLARDGEPAPVYFSPEADAAAQLIDAAPPEERARVLSVVRALLATFSQAGEGKAQEVSHLISQPAQTFAQRLIYGERDAQRRGELSR